MKIERERGLLHRLDSVKARPILIMGLHRSGTTWLYETLASLLPVATLSVYDIVHYSELLAAHEDGTAPALKRAIDARFGGASTRGFDEIALSHATLDEYGFVLRHHAGRALVDARTLSTFNELVRKLAFVQGHEHVLLKNPWDTRQGAFLAEHVPEAKFIFLRRDPLRILDSQLRMLDGFIAGDNPLLTMLLEGLQPETALFGVQRRLRKVIGAERFRRGLVRLVEKHVRDELGHYRQSLAAVPSDRRVELDYDALIADPTTVLEPALRLVGLPLLRPLSMVSAKPRSGTLLPEVAACAERLRAAVASQC